MLTKYKCSSTMNQIVQRKQLINKLFVNYMLKTLDLFGTSVQLRIFSNSQFHSLYSIFLSFIFLILVCIYSYFFGLDCYFQKNPSTLQSIINPKQSESLLLNHSTFFTAWHLEDFLGDEVNVSNVLYPVVEYYNSDKQEKKRNY